MTLHDLRCTRMPLYSLLPSGFCFINAASLRTSTRILPLLKYSPLHGLMQAHRTRHKPTNRNEVHCLNNTIHYPNMGTVKKAAEIYGLSPHYIRRLCRTGKIRYVNAGHKWLINLDSLAKYFEQGDPSPADQSQTAHGIRQIG